jgi:predicted DNA-binding protein (MmcQ/YjbR family)
MHQFHISIRSFRQVQEFVSLAMVQPFEVLVGNEKQQVNGKSFIGMFSLDHRKPLCVSVKCSDEVFDRFRQEAANIFI